VSSDDEGNDSQSPMGVCKSCLSSDCVSTGDDESDDVQSPMGACKSYRSSTWASANGDSCNEQGETRLPEPGVEEEGASEQLKPCLLLQMQVLRRQSVKVKNTFIDDFVSDDEEDDRPPMVATKSCPPRQCAEMWLPTPAQVHLAVEEDQAKVEHGVAESASYVVAPLEQRQPEFSLGSQLHATGNCKPCAWFWRPLGCNNGPECGHCHLCTAEELKVRKKERKKATKKVKSAKS